MKHDFSIKFDRKKTNSWKWNFEGAKVKYPMGIADTDFHVAKPILEALHNRIDNCTDGYGAGCLEFAQSISGYYARRHNYNVSPEHIRYGHGLMLALKMLCDAFTQKGDMVILQPPVYFSFRATIESDGRNVLDNPLILNENNMTYEIDFEDLERKASNPRAKMMVVCNPANPISKAFTKEELLRIFEICHKNNVVIVSDEVHSDIYYDGRKHIPMQSVSEEAKNNTIVMSADGKTFNIHSFYTSYIIIPNDYMRDQYDIQFENYRLDYSDLGCYASSVAYSKCDYYVDGLVEYLAENRNYLIEFLEKESIDVKIANPQATYLMWVDFRKWEMSSTKLKQYLDSYDVGLTDGSRFGFGGDGFMRMNIACHKDTLAGALNAIKLAYEGKNNVNKM